MRVGREMDGHARMLGGIPTLDLPLPIAGILRRMHTALCLPYRRIFVSSLPTASSPHSHVLFYGFFSGCYFSANILYPVIVRALRALPRSLRERNSTLRRSREVGCCFDDKWLLGNSNSNRLNNHALQ